MRFAAREIGRSLEITVGGPEPDMDEREREIAARDVRRIVVAPVDAETGRDIWAHYARILFRADEEADEDPAALAVEMTRKALSAWCPDDAPAEEQARCAARWAELEAFRWNEAEIIANAALSWNAQGGGIEVVTALFEDGYPKAQELLLTRNELWNVYSRLGMLTPSRSSAAVIGTPRPAASSGTSTPSGTSEPVQRDAFGVRRNASEQAA